MKIVRTGNSNGPVMAVLASMDEELPRTRNLVGELQRYGIDSLIVVDSGPEFKFARTLERLGIKPQGKPHRAVTDALSAMLVYEAIKGKRDE